MGKKGNKSNGRSIYKKMTKQITSHTKIASKTTVQIKSTRQQALALKRKAESERSRLNYHEIDKKSPLWPFLSGCMALLVLTMVALPLNIPERLYSDYSLMLWWSFFGFFVFRHFNKNVMLGLVFGASIGIVLKYLIL